MRPSSLLLRTAALLLLATAGCSRNSTSAPSESSSQPSGNATLFTVPDQQIEHVQLVAVQPSRAPRVLHLTGTVAFNGYNTTPVITQVSGPVTRVVAAPGQAVKRGQPLLYVSSPDYSQLRAAYIKARDVHEVAMKNAQRAQDLYQHHAISEKDLLDAQSAGVQAEADLQSAEQGLHALGLDPNSATKAAAGEVPLLAPVSGEVVERLVSPGQLLQAGNTQAFTISDLRNVWVMANVYEDQLAFVHANDKAVVTSDAYPGVSFEGKITYHGAALDPTSRTLQARIEVQNPNEKLKKDMYVNVSVDAGSIENAILVPDSALLRDSENHPFVYVAAGKDQFARRQVETGQDLNGHTQITSGLKPGDQVVGEGALFLQFANSLQK